MIRTIKQMAEFLNKLLEEVRESRRDSALWPNDDPNLSINGLQRLIAFDRKAAAMIFDKENKRVYPVNWHNLDRDEIPLSVRRWLDNRDDENEVVCFSPRGVGSNYAVLNRHAGGGQVDREYIDDLEEED